jgi:hypothetical protein
LEILRADRGITMHHASTLTAAILLFVGSAIAGPFEDATTARKSGDYETALNILRPLAEQGDAEAQLALGVMSVKGQGVPPDLEAAQTWFKQVVENPAASKEAREDAISNRGIIARKLKDWAAREAAAATKQEAAAARQFESSRGTAAAAQRVQELQEENERTRLRILKQEQKESARRREELDAEIARRNAAIDQVGADYWDDREKARRRANGGTSF